MKIFSLELENAKLIIPESYDDERGYLMESFSLKKFRELTGLENVLVQDNHSMSIKAGTLRGIHLQLNPKAQSKLVRCIKGAVLDVIVDLKNDSPTFKKWIATELTPENRKQVWVPNGFGHGFLTLTDYAEVQYKMDEYYSPVFERSLAWNDPDIGIDWGINNPILSQKDMEAPLLKESDVNFTTTLND